MFVKYRPDCYWLFVRDAARVLNHFMTALAGDARVSFEGDIAHLRFPLMLKPSPCETAVLHRQSLVPRLEFVTLPLEAATVQPILDLVAPGGRLIPQVVHVQIEKKGRLEFAAYDRFADDAVTCGGGTTPVRTLWHLERTGAIERWTLPHTPNTRRSA